MTATRSSGARPNSRLAWVAFSFVALCLVASLLFLVLLQTGPDSPGWGEIAGTASFLIAMFSFPVVGVFIASRQPGNPIGWILLAIGLVWELASGVSDIYVHYGFVTNPGSLPRPDLVAALTSSSWVPGVGLMGTFLILLFPNGHLPSPRWKPLAWLSAFALIELSILIPVSPGSLGEVAENTSLPDIPNPLGIEALSPVINALYAVLPLLPLCMLGCALSLIGRFRRSRGHERLQLKWLAAGAGVTAAIYFVTMLSSLLGNAEWFGEEVPLWLGILQGVSAYSFVLIPAAVGIAILRHRLYDIDVIINRALVYGALTASLALAYVIGVVGAGALLRVVSGQETNNLAVAASTLAVAALFRPARSRIQAFIDRRFYRRKYDAQQTLETFTAKLRDEVHLEAVTAELISVINDVVQPAHVSLWFREARSGGRGHA